MKPATLAALVLPVHVFAASSPNALTFNHALPPPTLSLSDSLRPPSFSLSRPAPSPSAPTPRGADVPSAPAPRLPLVEPNPDIDYKIANVTPDARTDFKMRILRPADASSPIDADAAAARPANKK